MNSTNTAADNSSTLNIMDTGILNFSDALGFDINGLFFTFLIYFLIIVAACLFMCLLSWFLFHTMGKSKNDESLIIKSKKMSDFTIGKKKNSNTQPVLITPPNFA